MRLFHPPNFAFFVLAHSLARPIALLSHSCDGRDHAKQDHATDHWNSSCNRNGGQRQRFWQQRCCAGRTSAGDWAGYRHRACEVCIAKKPSDAEGSCQVRENGKQKTVLVSVLGDCSAIVLDHVEHYRLRILGHFP
jgi:hypothetical protein